MSLPASPEAKPNDWDQLSLYLSQFDQRLNSLQQRQQASEHKQSSPRPVTRLLKPTNPDTFDGVSKNLRVTDWLFQCRCFFDAAGLSDDSHERTVFAAALLRGAASKWWKHETEAADRGDKPSIKSWRDFVAAIKTRFQTIDSDQVARDRLSELRQLGSVVQYVNLFQQITNEISDIAPSELLYRFLAGLKRTIRLDVEMYRLSHPNLTLAEAMTVAQRADAARSKYAPFRRDFSFDAPKPAQPSSPASEDADVVMSLNAMTNKPLRSKLTDQEKQMLRLDGRCFYCKEKGHVAVRCPLKNQKNV